MSRALVGAHFVQPEEIGRREPQRADERRQVGEQGCYLELVRPSQKHSRGKVGAEGRGKDKGEQGLEGAAEDFQWVVSNGADNRFDQEVRATAAQESECQRRRGELERRDQQSTANDGEDK